MSDMLAYRIGMLKNLNDELAGRAQERGMVYHRATFYEIRGLAELSMEVCPNKNEFAIWKERYSGSEFPTLEQFKREFSPEHAARMLQMLQDRLAQSVSAQKQQQRATEAYAKNTRPMAGR